MNNNIYIFDGSLAGFFTVFYHICQEGKVPADIINESHAQTDLFAVNIKVITDEEKAFQIWEQCRKLMSRNSLINILFCFLRDDHDFYNSLYNYCSLAWKYGRKLSNYQAHPDVCYIHKIGREVGHEIHRFKGILRFQEMKTGHLYAPFTPDYNITQALGHHFKNRLRGEKWVIHDVKRDLAIFWDGKSIQAIDMDPEFTSSARKNELAGWNSNSEILYQDLWQTFFDAVAIESRINPKLQRQFLPQRYWNYLTEK